MKILIYTLNKGTFKKVSVNCLSLFRGSDTVKHSQFNQDIKP